MSNPWSKFFWSDWETDAALKLCSFAAQGLWMRMLCIAAQHDPIGYVAVAGRPLDETAIARMTGGDISEVALLLTELDQAGVFSRDAKGRIYSRRMTKDARRSAEAKKNGKKGGNPNLSKQKEKSEGVKGQDKAPDKGGDKPHKPEARYSVSKDTGKKPPDMAKEFFDTGVAVLIARNHTDQQARNILGGWRKTYGLDEALRAVRHLAADGTIINPVEYVPKFLSGNGGQATLAAIRAQYVTA